MGKINKNQKEMVRIYEIFKETIFRQKITAANSEFDTLPPFDACR